MLENVTIITCHNSHECGDDGHGSNVDDAIRRCMYAKNDENMACQHCTNKYFPHTSAASTVQETMKQIFPEGGGGQKTVPVGAKTSLQYRGDHGQIEEFFCDRISGIFAQNRRPLSSDVHFFWNMPRSSG